MRTSPAIALIVAGVALLSSSCAFAPSAYTATALSSQWKTYTNEALGFAIKYPGKEYTVHLSRTLIGLEAQGATEISIQRFEKPMRTVMAETQAALPQSERSGSDDILINQLKAKRMKFHGGNFEGVWTSEYLYLQAGPYTYEISRSTGPGLHPPVTEQEIISREMIGTFRLIDSKRSGPLVYKDPAYGFSFTYPDNWELNAGPGEQRVNMYNGGGAALWIYVKANSTANDFLRAQRGMVKHLGDKQEYFDHHLVGRRCEWPDEETYIFEKGTATYLIRSRGPKWAGPGSAASAQDIESILNSLEL